MLATALQALSEALLTLAVYSGLILLVFVALRLVQRVYRDLHPKD